MVSYSGVELVESILLLWLRSYQLWK